MRLGCNSYSLVAERLAAGESPLLFQPFTTAISVFNPEIYSRQPSKEYKTKGLANPKQCEGVVAGLIRMTPLVGELDNLHTGQCSTTME